MVVCDVSAEDIADALSASSCSVDYLFEIVPPHFLDEDHPAAEDAMAPRRIPQALLRLDLSDQRWRRILYFDADTRAAYPWPLC